VRRHAAQFTVVRKAHTVSLSHTYVVHSPYTELAHAPQKTLCTSSRGPGRTQAASAVCHLQNRTVHKHMWMSAHENSLRLCRAWCSSARLGKSPNCQNRFCSHRLARINSLPDHVQPRASARMPRPENALSSLHAHHKAVHSPSHKPKKAGPTGSGASSSSRTAAASAAALHVHRQVLAQNLTRPGTAGSAAQCRSTAAHCTGCSSCSSGAGLISTAPS